MNLSMRAMCVVTVLLMSLPCLAGPAYDRKEDVIYGRKDGLALTLDVITPKETKNGVGLVLMMSGGWFSAHEMIVPQSIEGFMGELISRGYTVFAVVHGSQPRYTIPDAVSDVNRAVRFIKFHAKEYVIDPDRLGVYGGWAGGHLACMMGAASLAGDADTLVPIQQAKTFLDKLKEAGVETKLVVVPGGGHGFTDLPKHMKTIGDWFDLQLLKKTGATTR